MRKTEALKKIKYIETFHAKDELIKDEWWDLTRAKILKNWQKLHRRIKKDLL